MEQTPPENASIVDGVQYQYMTGCYYLHGDEETNQDPDFTKAREYLMGAAVAGHGQAAYNLGLMAINGHGRDYDAVCALKWMMIAKSLDPQISLNTLSDLLPDICDDLRERAQCAASVWLIKHPRKC
tara:strand:- start:145048 stop:145428 length:381 start_codon:yes stop_codon:yes gene_type:complete